MESRLPEPTRRAILMMRRQHRERGRDRRHDMLPRRQGLEASLARDCRHVREPVVREPVATIAASVPRIFPSWRVPSVPVQSGSALRIVHPCAFS